MRFRTIRLLTHASLLLALFTFSLAALLAQSVAIATVTGRIIDTAGAIIPGVQVKLIAVETGTVHAVTTNGDGIYTVPNLPIGSYRVEATSQGFQTYVQNGLLLQVNDSAQVNITLTVGQVSDRVEVEASASMVQTQQSNVSQVIDGRRIAEMPLNGRDPTQLILISGAAVNHVDGSNTGSKSFFSSQSISIAGGLGNQTNYLLDGGDNNDVFTNVNMPFPFPDALAEFSVEASSLPARNGLHPGGLVNAVTKSGSNQWHGTVFEFVRNGSVNAVNFFGKPDSLKRNQFGGTFGGKLITDKLFFFGGFQQSNIRQDPTNNTAFVPTAAMLAGDFTACNAGVKVDPSTYDKASLALAKYLPATSDPCGKVSWGAPVHSNEEQYVGRVDWTINSKHSLYGRYFDDKYDLAAFFDPTNILSTGVSGNSERAQSLTFGETYVVSPTIVNSLHLTATRRRDDRGPNVNGINATSLGITNVYQGTPDYLQLTVSNGGFAVGSGSGALGVFNITSYQEADDVDILKGKHQIAFGVDIIRTEDNQNNHSEDNGAFFFDGSLSNKIPLLDFLRGKMYHFEQSTAQQNAMRQTSIGAYAQDTFHITPKLVINFGLRWEPVKFPYDYFRRGSTFSRDAFNAGTRSNIFVNAPPGTLFYGDPGVTESMSDDRYTNFSPRLGFVYNPDGQGKTTFRIGGAMMYDSPGAIAKIANNPPYGPLISNSSGPYQFSNPWGTVPGGNPFPLPQIPLKTATFALSGIQAVATRHVHDPTVYQFNAGMQHQLGSDWILSISYLGNITNHSWLGNEINPAVFIAGTHTLGQHTPCGALNIADTAASQNCSTTGNTQARRILSLANPAYGQYYSQQINNNDGANGNYNGVLTSVEHRFAHNYTLLANYTWSKCLNMGPIVTIGTEGVVQNPYNIKSDYGYCTTDAPHIFNLSVVANSRVRGNRYASAILSNWQIAPLVRALSGLPFNITTGSDNSLTGINLDRPNPVAGVQVYTSGVPHLKSGIQDINKAAFTPNPLGTFGTARHYGYRGPGYVDVDMAISRDFRLYERLTMKARVEGFNILNHPNFMAPASSLASGTFGLITTANDPRILQGALKFTF